MQRLLILSLLTLVAVITTSFKANKSPETTKWDVANPPGEWEWSTHAFTTGEGTWMNLDVSPDGETIVFDMLGDIYSMPISGGKAKVLRSGIPFEIQPRFSPDGKYISFTSDAGGGDNIWVMKADGSDAKQITTESFRLINNAIWKGEHYLIARKHFTSQRSLGAGEMWMYHITGGSGLQLTKRKNDQQDVNEPCLSPDKKWLYYSEDMYPGGYFQYNKDPNDQIYVINRYNLETGKTERVTGGPGGAARPQLSPDGKMLAFVKRVRTKSVMYIHNLETGEEYPVYDQLSKDQMEAWCLFGVYTNFNWLPDNEHVVFWAGGKINKLNTSTLKSEIIPFEVNAKIQINKALEFEHPAFTESFQAKVIRQAVTAPDGKSLAFNAVGHLWSRSLPKGKPRRLTGSEDFEFEPSYSPDGRHLVYVSWNDEEMGEIRQIHIKGGSPTTLKGEKGIYRTPSFSPDGKWIVYRKESGNNEQGHAFSKNPGIYIMPAEGGEAQLITKQGEYPVFSADGHRIFFQTGGDYYGNLTNPTLSGYPFPF